MGDPAPPKGARERAHVNAETRFRALVAQGDPDEGIAILDKLDSYFSKIEKSE